MKSLNNRLALMLISGLLSHSAIAADVIATVNGKAIPAAAAEAVIAEQVAQGRPDNKELQDTVREELIRREVIAQAAIKAGIEKKADVKAQMDLARQAVLIRAYLQDYVKANPVTDAEVLAEYQSIKERVVGAKEYKPRHVLVETEDEATLIITKLNAGESFAELAKQSKDPGSKDKGGELGWSNPGMFVQPFADALVALEKGKFTTTPVKSDFGYHVILLEDVRDVQAPPFEEVKPQLQQRMQQQKIEQLMLDLRAKASVK